MANAGDIVARLRLENDDFRRGAEAAKQDMDQMSAKAQEASASISTIQKISGAAFAGVTATIGTSVAMAANFEQGMARVRGITGATDEEFAALEDTARSLGRSTRFTTQQAAEGMQYLAMAGFDTNQIISSMPGVLNLASAAQLDLGASSDIVSNIMTGFGLSADETGRAVDVLVETMTSANTDLPQLGHAMKFVAPVASALGLDIEETATAIAKMSDAGIQGGRAGTALRAALLSLANPTGQTIKAFEKLGIEVTTADGAMKPLPELIGHINGKLDGMTEAQRTQTVAQLVGREAASGFIALLEQGEDSLAKYAQGLRDSEGAAQQMADTQNNTVLGAFDAFKSALADIGISIGQEYLPAIRQLLDGATDMVRTFGELDPQLISMTLNFAAVSSGIALATTTIIKLGAAIRGLFIAMGPGGWLIVGLSLLAGAIVAHNIEAEKMAQVNLETANSLNDMHTELSEAASRYQELRTESKLTTDEFGELLDIRKEMASNPEAAALEALQERFDELSKKSGLTNEQLEEMLGLNQTIVDRAPQTVEAHSAQGEAIAGVNDKLQEYIDGF
ncbi:phage tail length tape-measure protein [Bacillus sp. JCM 19047]|nr:phage tail length tape-measure protein [Bacillus sp. JCM 19047]